MSGWLLKDRTREYLSHRCPGREFADERLHLNIWQALTSDSYPARKNRLILKVSTQATRLMNLNQVFTREQRTERERANLSDNQCFEVV